jgi:hypothetical protein
MTKQEKIDAAKANLDRIKADRLGKHIGKEMDYELQNAFAAYVAARGLPEDNS